LAGKDLSKILYYPGCTLYEKASHLDRTFRESAKALGMEIIELSNWTCCGAAFPLSNDNKMGLLAPTRILATAALEDPNKMANSKATSENTDKTDKESNEVYLTTLCAFCYNVLKRTNNLLHEDDYKLRKLNEFLEGELSIKCKS
jgi:heterodisulfide reductase subunit B